MKENMNELIDNLNIDIGRNDLLLDAGAEKRKK